MLTRAASRNPLPEYQWLLADTLRRIDRLEEADQVETLLKKSGRRITVAAGGISAGAAANVDALSMRRVKGTVTTSPQV